MSTSNSITRLLSGVKKADEEAVRTLFDRCYGRVRAIGHRELVKKAQDAPRGFDTDDVASAAFREFLDRAAAGKFRKLENGEDVWKILAMLVGDKISRRLRDERRRIRYGGVPDVPIEHVQHAVRDLDDPALEAEVAEVRSEFLRKLPDGDYRRIVELLEEGYTHAKIAKKLDISLRTVARRLDVIRSVLPRVLGMTDPRMDRDVQEEDNGAER